LTWFVSVELVIFIVPANEHITDIHSLQGFLNVFVLNLTDGYSTTKDRPDIKLFWWG